jgi:CTP synthase
MSEAHSAEFGKDLRHPVIALMTDQQGIEAKGGTMRLGAYPCRIERGTLAHQIYNRDEVSERHRHRYEVNNQFREQLAQHGLLQSGTSPDGSLVEMVELPNHPYFFVACQFHPEFKSRPTAAHPLFSHFVRSALAYRDATNNAERAKES